MIENDKNVKKGNNRSNRVILTIINLSFSYFSDKGEVPVLKNTSLDVFENEFICLVGPSGCGKSTLLNLVAGFLKPISGEILVNDEKVNGISHNRGVVFQDQSIFPWLTVYKNISYGLESRGVDPKNREDIVQKYLDLVQLEEFKYYYPRELSGGMKKKVEFARTLANDPEILLMDEPFGALDALTKEFLQIEVTRIWQKSKKTVVFVTHDLEEALYMGDRIAIMYTDPGIPLTLFNVPFARPRDIEIKSDTEFQKIRRNFINEFRGLSEVL